jgi:hypothetical protein
MRSVRLSDKVSTTLMVRSAATPRVSNHGRTGTGAPRPLQRGAAPTGGGTVGGRCKKVIEAKAPIQEPKAANAT